MSCSPPYTFRPKFIPSDIPSIAPGYPEHRSRLTAGGTFFRSIEQGQDRNNITLELIKTGGFSPFTFTLNIRFNGNLVETFTQLQTETPTVIPPPPTTCSGGISGLRTQVNASNFIQMTARGFDIFDGGLDDPGNCLSPFAEQNMVGGDGEPPISTPLINSIRTGPERTIIIITTTEDNTGSPVTPPASKRIKQFDGTNFITFRNLIPGDCPLNS